MLVASLVVLALGEGRRLPVLRLRRRPAVAGFAAGGAGSRLELDGKVLSLVHLVSVQVTGAVRLLQQVEGRQRHDLHADRQRVLVDVAAAR
jgi:hypothetical protein